MSKEVISPAFLYKESDGMSLWPQPGHGIPDVQIQPRAARPLQEIFMLRKFLDTYSLT